MTLVGSNALLLVTHDPCAMSENNTVCCPGVVTASKYALSLLSWVGNATRTLVDGTVGPLRRKQNPLTPCATVSYGCCGGPSFSSSAMPAPHAPVASEVVPDVHILPATLENLLAGGLVTIAQLTFLRSAQSLYSNQER